LRSRILALLHGTPAAGVSQTLRRGTRNICGPHSMLVSPNPQFFQIFHLSAVLEWNQRTFAEGAMYSLFGTAAITLGIGPHSSFLSFHIEIEHL